MSEVLANFTCKYMTEVRVLVSTISVKNVWSFGLVNAITSVKLSEVSLDKPNKTAVKEYLKFSLVKSTT